MQYVVCWHIVWEWFFNDFPTSVESGRIVDYSRLTPSLDRQLAHSLRDNRSSLSMSQNFPNDRAHRFGFTTFLTSRFSSRYSTLSSMWLPLMSSFENFQSSTLLSLTDEDPAIGSFPFIAPPPCWWLNRLCSLWNTLIRFELKTAWSWAEQPRRWRFRPWGGDRRFPYFGQLGLPERVVVFCMGIPWESEHQQPPLSMHWTAA